VQDGYFNVKGFDASYDRNNCSIEKRYLSTHDTIAADMVVLRHVLEDVPQPHSFLAMLSSVFGAAKIYIEVPNYDWIIDNNAYFDITYEHVKYFSHTSLACFFKKIAQHLGVPYIITEHAGPFPMLKGCALCGERGIEASLWSGENTVFRDRTFTKSDDGYIDCAQPKEGRCHSFSETIVGELCLKFGERGGLAYL